AGCAQCRLADEKARAKADAAGKLVRLGFEDCAKLDWCGPDGDACAVFEIQPREQGWVDSCAERAVALSQRIGATSRRLQRDFAVERIGPINRFHFDEGGLPVRCAR